MSSLEQDARPYDASHPRVVEAIKLAWEVRARAHVAYSGFRVGAALYLPEQDLLISGVNVENVSYGATICAERSAVVSAISNYGKTKYGFIAIATDLDSPASPCGMCLQVLAEFCSPDMPIFLVNAKGLQVMSTLRGFLPRSFTEF